MRLCALQLGDGSVRAQEVSLSNEYNFNAYAKARNIIER